MLVTYNLSAIQKLIRWYFHILLNLFKLNLWKDSAHKDFRIKNGLFVHNVFSNWQKIYMFTLQWHRCLSDLIALSLKNMVFRMQIQCHLLKLDF